MFWIKIIFLITAASIALVYTIYHIGMAIMLRRAQGREWILLTHEAYEYGRKGDYQKSIELAEEALKLNPNSSEAYRLIGNAYEFLGDEKEIEGDATVAREFYNKATEAWDRAKDINPKILIPGYHSYRTR